MLPLLAMLATPDEAPLARAHLVSGELARVDIGRRTLSVKTLESGVAREYDLEVPETARVSAGGRVTRIEDLRPGDRILVTCSDPSPGRHVARAVKIGPSRYAAPTPRSTAPPAQNVPGAAKP